MTQNNPKSAYLSSQRFGGSNLTTTTNDTAHKARTSEEENVSYHSSYFKSSKARDSGVEPTDLTQHEESTDFLQTTEFFEASGSHRMGSAISKMSAVSSDASTELTPIQDGMGDGDSSIVTPHPFSPASTISSQLSPAKSPTPTIQKTPIQDINAELSGKARNPPAKKKRRRSSSDLRPRTSIPGNLSPRDLARQSIHAAYSSRLNPFSLHPDEYQLLRDHICQLHVSAYLNIRNRILRLWVRNPLASVTPEEAAGCTVSARWLGLAEVAYQWLLRKGYINFGCVENPTLSEIDSNRKKTKRSERKNIIVIGAGMSGLGCARQLEGLFSHYRDRWTSVGEEPPKVIVLEGRGRIGGRVYSHPLKHQESSILPGNSRCTAELGAHIITGFDHGNPLSMVIRGQLALHYYPLKDNSTLFDIDGHVVDKERDTMVEKLYNDILDRASAYRHRAAAAPTIDGDRELIEAGRDPNGEAGPPVSTLEVGRKTVKGFDGNGIESVPGGVDKLTGKAHLVAGARQKILPAKAAETMGWTIASDVLADRELNLDGAAKSCEYPTLGAAMDEAVKQYQYLLDLSPQDMRLLNWHYANLEYANAANVGKLSLGGWDQDIGNEFEGEHAQVIGGYQQVPRGILHYPSKLDLRTYKRVKRIHYTPDSGRESVAKVTCSDGEVFEADRIVLTVPLGVLKDCSINFDPKLPDWKCGPIQRLGFGTLNKVVLLYEKPFWDIDQDMFGLLREPEVMNSLDQDDYVGNRGKFYLFWNCIKTSGLPVLIALMAGDAAHQAETVSDADLVTAVNQELARMFKQIPIPRPLETIITRWGKDRFARGTYSYVGAMSEPGDYNAMARPIGNLHFAGEATCGTHPATVHGAYISGLRAASEVIDAILGPIEVPRPLVPDTAKVEPIARQTEQKSSKADTNGSYKGDNQPPTETAVAKQARLEAFEQEILAAIRAELGLRPSRPGKRGTNPFLLYTADNWFICKAACDKARQQVYGGGSRSSRSSRIHRDEIRIALGRMWREASEDVKRPYIERSDRYKMNNNASAATFEDRLSMWDAQAMAVRRKFVEDHPNVLTEEEEREMWRNLEEDIWQSDGADRRAKKVSGYAEDNTDSEA